MNRATKLKIIQGAILIIGLVIIYFSYYRNNSEQKSPVLSEKIKSEITRKNEDAKKNASNIFYDIKYSGIDLSGNRYVLTAKEAVMRKSNNDLLELKKVDYIFYFDDGTNLKVVSNFGLYNNKTLDMKFIDKVIINYGENLLEAENAEYSKSENYLKILNNVNIKSNYGNILADELFFDLNNKKLDINSFKDNNIKANIRINEKRF